MEAWLQVQAAKYLSKTVGETPALLRPPPREAVEGPFMIGTVLCPDRELYPACLDDRALMGHVGVFGRTGSGKTNCTLALLKKLQDCGVKFLVLDWKRNYRDALVDMDDLKVFTVGRPVFACPGCHTVAREKKSL
jgi:hypothetical protein